MPGPRLGSTGDIEKPRHECSWGSVLWDPEEMPLRYQGLSEEVGGGAEPQRANMDLEGGGRKDFNSFPKLAEGGTLHQAMLGIQSPVRLSLPSGSPQSGGGGGHH